MLARGLKALKRKGTAASGSAKRARAEGTSSAAPARATSAADVLPDTERPTARASPRGLSSPTEVPASEIQPEEVPGGERRKRRKTLVRRVDSHQAATEESRGSEEEQGDDPFSDRDLIKKLVDGCSLPKVIQRIVRVDPTQRVWDSLGAFLELGHQLLANIETTNKTVEGQQAEAAHLKKMALEVAGLREALERERQTSAEQKADLEEMVRRAEAEVANMAEQIPTLISEARSQAVEEFETSIE
ncbi:uncharacterized protein [Elaeis guineensis]|uniref:uncharacterized protein n=1 Tax=Elaeis guineensis var. tenera TaxID=51953 RepID=UPI003C6D72E2